jgi:hypothetical protein
MTIRELLSLESKVSNVEEFFALLYNQNIHPAFKVFSDLSINFRALEGIDIFCLEREGAVYFKLCFSSAPFLIYQFNNLNDCENAWCVDFELYKSALRNCVKAVDKKYIPVKDINENIS